MKLEKISTIGEIKSLDKSKIKLIETTPAEYLTTIETDDQTYITTLKSLGYIEK